MKMQRRHFELIARTLLATQPAVVITAKGSLTAHGDQWCDTVMRFKDALSQTNDYFKPQTFLYAAGMTDKIQDAYNGTD